MADVAGGGHGGRDHIDIMRKRAVACLLLGGVLAVMAPNSDQLAQGCEVVWGHAITFVMTVASIIGTLLMAVARAILQNPKLLRELGDLLVGLCPAASWVANALAWLATVYNKVAARDPDCS